MKVTFELTEAELEGITNYLKKVSSVVNPDITKKEIQQEIKGLLDASLQSGAIADYIQAAEKEEQHADLYLSQITDYILDIHLKEARKEGYYISTPFSRKLKIFIYRKRMKVEYA